MNKTSYIKAILVVFALLLFTRIPAFATGNIDALTLVSTIVELIFFIWGIVLIVRK